MPWAVTAQQLVAAFKTVRGTGGQSALFPHGWVLLADLPTHTALKGLHDVLCPLLNSVVTPQNFHALLPDEPCVHPKAPLDHPFETLIGGPYGDSAITLLANRLVTELVVEGATSAQMRANPDLRKLLSFVRDAADCD